MICTLEDQAVSLSKRILEQTIACAYYYEEMPEESILRQRFFQKDNLWKFAIGCIVLPIINDYYPSLQQLIEEQRMFSAQALARIIHERFILFEFLTDSDDRLLPWVKAEMCREYWFVKDIVERDIQGRKDERATSEMRLLAALLGDSPSKNGGFPGPQRRFEVVTRLLDERAKSEIERWMIKQPSGYIHSNLTVSMRPRMLHYYVRYSTFLCLRTTMGVCLDNDLLNLPQQREAKELVSLCDDILTPYRIHRRS
ncbi:MAG: hypothetical protein OXN21_16135 [Chloroflexota bacterium]|nr:hypothetical protein [Chloroflexota bacterium]